MHDSVTCSLTLRHDTENRYVKCPVHFFCWNIFHSLRNEQKILTNIIAGKLMNRKKIKLFKGCTLNEDFFMIIIFTLKYHIHNSGAPCFDMQPY